MSTETAIAINEEMREQSLPAVDGRGVLQLCGIPLALGIVSLVFAIRLLGHGHGAGGRSGAWVAVVVCVTVAANGFRGLVKVAPGEAVVGLSFGRYVGTLRTAGLWWVYPWVQRRRVSVKLRSHVTEGTKVNDAEGNPIEVSAVFVWRVADTARALFEVDDYESFMAMQCDAALRELVASHSYDDREESKTSLSGSAIEVTDQLTLEISQRVAMAGISVVESRIVRIAYAPEIAQVMLRRQQASAIVSARQTIVEGAVGMVELALNRLDEEHVVDLDEERKAAMVSNLLVVLCSDHPTQPILNAGTLYH